MKSKLIWLAGGILLGLTVGFGLGITYVGFELNKARQVSERKLIAERIRNNAVCDERIYEILHRLTISLNGYGKWITSDGDVGIKASPKRRPSYEN